MLEFTVHEIVVTNQLQSILSFRYAHESIKFVQYWILILEDQLKVIIGLVLSIIIVLFIILLVGGIFSYSQLSYELIPKFEVNVVTVATVYPGASPGEVENTVTKKLEDAVSTLENVKKIESKSYESLSVVMITLTSDADADYSLNDAQRKINADLKDLPEDVDPPSLSKFSLSDLPIMTIGATANMDDVEFYDLLDKKIQPILSRVQGVAQVNLVGGQEREIQVNSIYHSLATS